jgi:hypothetical protein
MSNSIVQINISTQSAPTPSNLQKMGAFISQGGTTLTAQTTSLLTSSPSLTSFLKGALAITSIAWASNVATVTTTAPHGYTNADTMWMVIAGAVPVGYNGTFLATITGTSTFTYPLAVNPGSETTAGTYQLLSAVELVQMNNTFWAQGTQLPIWVLELGAGSPVEGVTALTTYLGNNPNAFYAYLIPRKWDAVSSFLTFMAGFENPTSLTYFFITTTLGNYASYTAAMKCAFTEVESPTATTAEFQVAGPFWDVLSNSPSSTNRVTPLAFTYQYGITAYPISGNLTTFASLKAAGVNVAQTGAEGGSSNVILKWGTTMDLNPFNYWYSVDWTQINIKLTLSAVIINGSNNSTNPLYYNQQGINTLQDAAANILTQGIGAGLIVGSVVQTTLSSADFTTALNAGQFVGQCVINAVPFTTYSVANPTHYAQGIYNGLSITMTPQIGFEAITINLTVENFIAL